MEGSGGNPGALLVLAIPLLYVVALTFKPAGTLILSGLLLMYGGFVILVFGALGGAFAVAFAIPVAIMVVCAGAIVAGLGAALQATLGHLARNHEIAANTYEAATYFEALKRRQQPPRPQT